MPDGDPGHRRRHRGGQRHRASAVRRRERLEAERRQREEEEGARPESPRQRGGERHAGRGGESTPRSGCRSSVSRQWTPGPSSAERVCESPVRLGGCDPVVLDYGSVGSRESEPPLLLDDGSDTECALEAVLRAEAEARRALEWQSVPGKHAVLSLVAAAAARGGWWDLAPLLPPGRDNDASRLALAVAVSRGDSGTCAAVLSKTGFLGTHRVICSCAGTPPAGSLFGFLVRGRAAALGVPDVGAPEGASFVGLAAAAMARGMDAGDTAAKRAERAEVLRALIGCGRACANAADAAALHECASHPALPASAEPAATLRYWSPALQRGEQPVWSPEAHHVYPPAFRRVSAAVARVLLRRGVGGGVLRNVLEAVDFARPLPDAFPRRLVVADAEGVFDGGTAAMARFAHLTTTGRPPAPGQSVAVRSGDGTVRTGTVVGCSADGVLHWRPDDTTALEPLGEVTINIRSTRRPPEQGAWVCRACRAVSAVSMGRCRRCGAHRVEVCPPQRRPPQSPRGRPGVTVIRVVQQQQQQQPFQMLNLSADPPQMDVFEAGSPVRSAYGLSHGDRVWIGTAGGTVVGTARDGSLFWAADADGGLCAKRLCWSAAELRRLRFGWAEARPQGSL